MTLEKTLRQQLSEPGNAGFHVHADGWNITLASDKGDSLSCSLNELALDHAAPVSEELRDWAQRVAENATGLMEPLHVIEVDARLGKALLRSETPCVRDGKSYYYELLLARTDRSSANLNRYVGDRNGGEKRAAVSFVLTHDAIVKLVNDIVGTNG